MNKFCPYPGRCDWRNTSVPDVEQCFACKHVRNTVTDEYFVKRKRVKSQHQQPEQSTLLDSPTIKIEYPS